MTTYPGKKTYLMLAYQSGTTAVTPTIGIRITDEDLWTIPTDEFPEEYCGSMENVGAPIRRWQESGGSVACVARPGGSMEYFVYGAMGTVASTPLGDVYNQHTFTVNNDALPSFSIGKGLSTLNFYRYNTGKIKDFEMAAAEKGDVTITTNWITKAIDTDLTTLTPSFATPAGFGYLGSTVTIEGATSDDVKTVSIKIDRGTEGEAVMDGNMENAHVEPNVFVATIDGTALFDATEYNRYLGNPASTALQTTATPLAMKVKFTGGTIVTGTPQQIEWDFPECYYTAHKPKFTTDGRVKVDFTARAIKNTAAYAAKAIAITTAASPLVS